MNNARINNYRMAAYAAIATGLINLRYQTGAQSNFTKSAFLFLPGFALLLLTLVEAGKKFLQGKIAAVVISVLGISLLAYSFLI